MMSSPKEKSFENITKKLKNVYKIFVTFELIMQIWCPSRFRIPRTKKNHFIYEERQTGSVKMSSIIRPSLYEQAYLDLK